MRTKLIEMPCNSTLAPDAIDSIKKAINTDLYLTDIRFALNKDHPEKSIFIAVMEEKPPETTLSKEEINTKQESLTKLNNNSI
tara:strand:- start:353 stop:601 length:249 start_codon:yes stop_codon:yes gene_type:complete